MRLATPLLLALLALSGAAGLLPTAARAQSPGDCTTGTAEADLAISDVEATVFDTGSLFFGNTSQAAYEVPRFSGKSPLFAAGVWIGGKVNGQLRVAGATYTDFEFWPGPLDLGAVLPEADCRRENAHGREAWDRIYAVSVFDVEAYEQGGPPTPDLEDWPVGLGAPAVDADGDPVVPTDRDQLIDLAAGERPVLYGGQTAFWVMNDVGNQHDSYGTAPIGLEVRVSAFAIPDPDDPAFDRGTFYRYEVVNRNSQPLTDAYFSLFTDPDLGDGVDDYVGSDSTRSLMYTYNADNVDGTSAGYGTPPPALGFDLLTGASSAMYFIGGGPPGTSDPANATEVYNVMQGRWTNGAPLVECGMGIACVGPTTVWAFPGDPVAGTGWTEYGENTSPGDRRAVVTAGPFTLASGASRTFDLAIVFAVGDDHLDSVTEVKAASDRMQAAYDDGSLFEMVDVGQLPDPPSEAPALLAPPDGAVFTEGDVALAWGPVDRAAYYEVQLDTDPAFASPETFISFGETLTVTRADLELNHQDPFYWRVRGVNISGGGPFSAKRAFTYFIYQPAWAGNGDGLVERAYPGVDDVCAGAPADPGCQYYGGNTVWHDANSTDDYYLSAGGAPGDLLRLSRYIEAAVPDEFEVRFTEAGGYALYGFTTDAVVRVPFELWNIGPEEDGENDPSDDLRMIPFLNPNADERLDWEDGFTGTDPWPGSPCEGGCPITDWIYGMMPDRPEGYALLEEAALASGGPGAVFVDTDVTATDWDIDPVTGEYCASQGYYVAWCYRNQVFMNNPPSSFIYPFGRLVFADLAGDGTTPPKGTVVRLITEKEPPVANEPDGTGLPEAYALSAVYPNPFRARTTVAYALPRSGRVRLAIYDLLGREVAVLADGPQVAGRHEAMLEGARLASGLYVVVLTGEDGARATAKITLLR